MENQSNSKPTFNVGITLAGAGSAGCYTAGVMDYLFEILDLWEKAKNKNLPGYEEFYSLIPDHNVVIDVVGGTSAGGISALMSVMYILNGEVIPVKGLNDTTNSKNNILYDSWVRLDDDEISTGKRTLAKAWELDDLSDNKFVALINSKIIDDIAERVFNRTGVILDKVNKLPSYISKDLDVLQVITMLRGIPLAIDFSTQIENVVGVTDAPSHNTFEHFIVSHYKLNNGVCPDLNKFQWFNPYDKTCADKMKLTTKSTGSFPVGLRFREFDQSTFTDAYIQCVTERTIFNRFGQKKDNQHVDWTNFPVPFNFVAIDGGAINNEPFGEVLGILKYRYNECIENGYAKYGVIMVDPFPDVADKNDKYEMPDDLFGVIPAIISSLHEQSKVKRDDMVEASEHPYFRGEILPRKWVNNQKDPDPIASATVSAFGGFLDLKFRQHDFFLGRDNARHYFRYFFSFEYTVDTVNPEKSVIHPIHKSWTKEMIEKFKVTGKDGKTYLPIIPDLNILQELKSSGVKRDPFDYTIKDKPVYDPIALFDQRGDMKNRFKKIIEVGKLSLTKKGDKPENVEVDKWMEKYYHQSRWAKFKGMLVDKGFNFIFNATKGGLADQVTEIAIKWILTDLEKGKFLKKYEDNK